MVAVNRALAVFFGFAFAWFGITHNQPPDKTAHGNVLTVRIRCLR